MRSTRTRLVAALFLAVSLAACVTPVKRTVIVAPPPRPVAPPPPPQVELGHSSDVIVRLVQPGDTRTSLAQRILNDPAQTRRIIALDKDADAPAAPLRVGEPVAIALGADFPGSRRADAAARVPVLCYHRFTASKRGSQMEVTGADFDRQLQYLQDHGYTIITLAQLAGFLNGAELPAKSVVLTIDDGYRSAFTVAYPLLRAHGTPATLFVYSDFIGGGDALTWQQLAELRTSKLIDIQAHSKTHTDMTKRQRRETETAYQRRLARELETPRTQLKTRLGVDATAFAYPYGAANSAVLAQTRRDGYALGLTVLRGGNPSWTDPLMLRRDMIYGTDTLDQFARKLAAAEAPGKMP